MQKKEENGILITLAPPGSMNLAAFFFNTRVIYRLQKNYVVRSSYGKYMTGNIENQDGGNYTQVLYNAKTKKAKRLLSATDSVVYGNAIYYYITYDGAGSNKFAIKKSNLSGKNIINIKTGKDLFLMYLGKHTAYLHNYGTGVTKKLVYKTKKLTTVR